ncbi:MAG: hypothetical protein OEZ43_09530 [Gammaproteobacteria bacterium]|nr:hypothetical protein [Gammaproteobacteria bacterium]
MALIWQKTVNGVDYEVRSAGRSRRLYANGVCHTQYHPQHIVSGSVWDMLALPVFFHPKNSIKRVLLLGLGGGAVVHMLRHFVAPDEIVVVERDAIHISVARKFFDLNQRNVNICKQDAVAWMESYAGAKFDLIIDDLFSHADGIPRRAVSADRNWANLLARNLRHDGALVLNFGDRDELKASVFNRFPPPRTGFVSAFVLRQRSLDNHILFCSRQSCQAATFRKHIRQHRFLAKPFNQKRLNFSVASYAGGRR